MELEKEPKFIEVSKRAARAEEQLVGIRAGEVIRAKLAEADRLPELTRLRMAKALATAPPVKDGELDKAALEQRVDEAVKEEIEYLAGLNDAGHIRGMGQSHNGDGGADPEIDAKTEASMRRLGLSESGAKVAAAGRKGR